MSDPRQPIYNALNWMAGEMPSRKPNDSSLVIDAYDAVCDMQDRELQKTLLEVIRQLNRRNATIGNMMEAWDKSAIELRGACKMIDQSEGGGK